MTLDEVRARDAFIEWFTQARNSADRPVEVAGEHWDRLNENMQGVLREAQERGLNAQERIVALSALREYQLDSQVRIPRHDVDPRDDGCPRCRLHAELDAELRTSLTQRLAHIKSAIKKLESE